MAWNIVYQSGTPNNGIVPPKGTLSFSGFAPSVVNTGASRTIQPGTGSIISASAAPSVAINPPGIVITNASTLAAATNGQPYSNQIQATGGTGPYWFVLTGSYNNGLIFNGDGTFVGIPQLVPPNVAATDTFTLTAYDNAGNSSAPSVFTLTTNVATGALGIATALSLPNATVGGAYAVPITGKGGTPVYEFSLQASSGANGTTTAQIGPSTSTNTKYVATNGWLQFAPTIAGTDTFTIGIKDLALGTTSVAGFTVVTTSTIAFLNPPRLPPGTQNGAYRYQMQACGGSGSGYTYAPISGVPPGLSLSSGGKWTGTPTQLGAFSNVMIQVTDNASNTVTVAHNMSFAPQALVKVSRPGYNASTANGFFVLGTKLYDPNGFPFVPRGFNKSDYAANDIATGVIKSGANCIRLQVNSAVAESTSAAIATTATNAGIFVDVMRYATAAGSSTNTPSTAANVKSLLSTFLKAWTDNFALWSPLMSKISCNFANEWGSGNPTIWQQAHQAVNAPITGISTTTITFSGASPFNTINVDSLSFVYIKGAVGVADGVYPVTAQSTNTITGTFPSGYVSGGTVWAGVVGVLRAQGYTCPIFLNLENDSQNLNDLSGGNAAAILASDPLQNIVFCQHAYSTSNLACPITNVTIAGSTATITYNSQMTTDPMFTNNYNSYGITITGVSGITGLNGRYTAPQPSSGGSVGAWKAHCTGTFSGTYTPGTGFLYDNYHYALAEQYMASFGLCIVNEESSPGYAGSPPVNNSPYFTSMAPGAMLQYGEHYGIGWLPWAWENGASNNSFGMTYHLATSYVTPSDLTWYGADVVLNPQYGLIATAVYAPSMS